MRHRLAGLLHARGIHRLCRVVRVKDGYEPLETVAYWRSDGTIYKPTINGMTGGFAVYRTIHT